MTLCVTDDVLYREFIGPIIGGGLANLTNFRTAASVSLQMYISYIIIICSAYCLFFCQVVGETLLALVRLCDARYLPVVNQIIIIL